MRNSRPSLLLALALAAPCTSQIIIDASSGLDGPFGLTLDSAGNVYVGGLASNVFKITPSGVITTVIDINTVDDQGNPISLPLTLTTDSSDNLYVSGLGVDAVFKVTPGGTITRIIDSTGDGVNSFLGPRGVTVDGAGNAYVVGENSDNAFKITPGGTVTQILDATGDGAGNTLDFPWTVELDAAGNVYVAGQKANALSGQILGGNVFKITPGGTITTIIDATGDGTGNLLDQPRGLAVDASGNVFVSGFLSANVFKITPGGAITEVLDASGDGAGNTLSAAYQLAVDGAGNLYVPNYEASAGSVFKVTPGGVITEIIDAPSVGILGPTIVAVTPSGSSVYVTGHHSRNLYRLDQIAPPTADAGPDQSNLVVPLGQPAQLDGSGSSGASLQYAWTLVSVPIGSAATLSDANTATPSFVPDVDGDYTAELVVTDGGGLSSTPDQVLVSIAVDDPPMANAGPDQCPATGATVQLDGSLSTDDLTASLDLDYAWSISSAPAMSTAMLTGATSDAPSFVPVLAGDYTVTLVVTDASGQASAIDSVIITASTPNAAPTADAGADATTATGVAVQFDGSASSDPDLDALTFLWSLSSAPAGSAAMLVDETTDMPSLTADLPGTYVVDLIVNDGMLDSAVDSVEVEAIDATDFARAKIHEADGYIAGLPLSSFYSGTSNNPNKQAKRAKITKRWLRSRLRQAAWRAFWLDWTVTGGGSSAQIAAKQRSTLRALCRVVLRTDGQALRGSTDTRGSGFRLDLITDPVASLTVYDCLQLAIGAVEAVQ